MQAKLKDLKDMNKKEHEHVHSEENEEEGPDLDNLNFNPPNKI